MAYTLTNNSPSAGHIAWSNVHLVYDGVDYAITNGSTNLRYVYWLLSAPTVFQVSDTYPALNPTDAIIFINKVGVGISILESSVIDGSVVVPGTIMAGALAADSVSASNIVAGAIETDKLAAGAVTALKINAGAVETDHLAAGAVDAGKINVTDLSAISANMGDITSGTLTIDQAGHIKGGQTEYGVGSGFWMGYDVDTYKFSMGNATKGFTWDGSAFTIKGDFVAGSINLGEKFAAANDGAIVIKSAASGARLEITNNVIKVFDAAGVVRVKLGDLT